MIYPRLQINHNHGVMLLANATINNGEARGTVIGGGVTNRLFHVSSHTPYKIGAEEWFPVYGRLPRHESTSGTGESGQWVQHATPGNFVIDCCFCG